MTTLITAAKEPNIAYDHNETPGHLKELLENSLDKQDIAHFC